MGQIQHGRYDHLLRRTSAQVGPGSKVGNALEDLFPTLDVENVPMELLRALGWRLGLGGIDVTAAAGTTNIHDLFNPANSRHLLVLTKLIVCANMTVGLDWGLSTTVLAGVINTTVERDTRLSTTAETVGQIHRQDNGGTPASGNCLLLANTPFELWDPNGIVVLAPGTGFRMGTPNLAVRLMTSWFWRERVAEPEELDF